MERLTKDLNEFKRLAKKAFKSGENIPQFIYDITGKKDYGKITIKLYRNYYWVYNLKPRVKLITLYRKGDLNE